MKKYNNNSTVKSVIYLVIFISIILSVTNCKKNKDTTNLLDNKKTTTKFNVLLDNNRLVFTTREDYENTIKYLSKKGDEYFPVWEKEMGFKSAREVEQGEKNSELEFDALFATLINPEHIIQIENHIFKIDMKNEKVYVLNKDDFVSEKSFANKFVESFSIYDNVLDIIDGNKDETFDRSDFCDPQKLGPFYWNTSGGQVKYKIVYQSAGIYHSLQAKIKKDHWGGAEYISLSTDDLYGRCFARNKSDCYEYEKTMGGYDREYNYRPYSSTKRLKAYRWRINFYMRDYGISPGVPAQSQTLEILCNESNHC